MSAPVQNPVQKPAQNPPEPEVRPPVADWMHSPAPAPLPPRLGRPFLILAAVAILAALAAGWALRSVTAGEPEAPPLPPRTVELGPARLAVEGDWTPERVTLAGVPGLDDASAATVAFAPAQGLRAHVLLTLAPADHPTLVPTPLRAMLSKPLPEPRKVKLLGAPAWRYAEQPLYGDRLMEITVAPTTAGVLTLACIAPRAAWVAAVDCASGVQRASLADAAWLPPAADLAVRMRVPEIVERLDRRRVEVRPRLQRATTRRGQSRLARRLGRAYERAATTLAPDALASGPSRRVLTTLRRSSAAHEKLAKAAANAWPKRYRQARRDVKRGDAALRRALARLR